MKRFAISWVVLGVMALLVAFAPLPHPKPAPTERQFRVEAGDFAFTPAVLHVNPGDTVVIEFGSIDVVHSLYVDGYDLNLTADPGQPATLTFTADRPGTFRLRCSVTCGALHPFMVGKLQVGSTLLLWRGSGLAFVALLGIFLIRKPSLNADHPLAGTG